MLSTRRTRRRPRARCRRAAPRARSRARTRAAPRRTAVMAVSGVRRSCETDCRSAARRRSVSLSACSSTPSCWQPRAAEREAEDAAERLEHRERLRVGRAGGPVSTASSPNVTPLSRDRERDQPVVAAQADDLRRLRRDAAPARGASVAVRSSPVRSLISLSATRHAQRRAAQPERAAEIGERAAQRRAQVVAADEADRERLQLLHAARSPRGRRARVAEAAHVVGEHERDQDVDRRTPRCSSTTRCGTSCRAA